MSKQVVIDFLYLDLNTCERCQGTESNLDQAVDEVAEVLIAAGYEMTVNKVNITSREIALEYEFLSSPTIRVNGRDLALEVKENACTDCGDICGDGVDCRVWTYEGIDYTEPPKAMIINGILKGIYGEHQVVQDPKVEYSLPLNLEVFFNGLEMKSKGLLRIL